MKPHFGFSCFRFGVGRPWSVSRTMFIIGIATFLLLGQSTFTVDGAVVRHELQVVVGDAVDIPCEIDLQNCGSLHSVKFFKDKQRVFTYHNNSDPPTILLDGGLALVENRVQFEPENPVGALHLKQVYLLDEGLYRCEVTYLRVKEGCKTLTITSVTTLVKPKPPEILFEGVQVDKNRIGPFVEGTTISLTCESHGGKPVARLTWKNASEIIEGHSAERAETDETGRAYNTIQVVIGRADLFSRFECSAMNEALTDPQTTWIEFDVQVRPLTIGIVGMDAHVIEGDKIFLECKVTGARPAATIAWFNDTKEIDGSNYGVETFLEDGGFTHTTYSTYVFKSSMYDNLRRMRCVAKNSVTETLNEENLIDTYVLDVYYSPRVSISPSGNLTVNYNGSFELFCQYDAHPMNLTEILWLRNGAPIEIGDNSDENDNGSDEDYDTKDRIVMSIGSSYRDDKEDTNEDDKSDDDDDDDAHTYPRLFVKTVMHVDKGVYTCRVSNRVSAGYSRTSVTVEVYFPPVVELQIEPMSVFEDENANVTLWCRLLEANPFYCDRYIWLKDGNIFRETEDNETVLYDVDRDEMADYSCVGHNKMTWGRESKRKELLVKYLPGVPTIKHDPLVVIKGRRVNLTCDVEELGQPPATDYKWFRGSVLLEHAVERDFIETVTLNTLANFTCNAINDVGGGPQASLFVNITAAPEFIQPLPETFGVPVVANEVSLSCQVECWPRCDIEWQKNGVTIDDESIYYSIKTDHLPIDDEHSYLNSVLSTLTWNLDAWPDKRLIRGEDNANYTCLSTGNGVGDGVSSTTFFQIEFAPENIKVSETFVPLELDEIPPLVTCTAESYPPAKYRWEFGNDVVSGTNELHLNYAIQKEQSGNYTCIAYNSYGNDTTEVQLDVQYKPECEIDKEITQDGKIVITCKVDANPESVTFEWLKDNQTITENVYTDGLESFLRFPEAEEHFGLYVCRGINSVGETDPHCDIEITGKGGWLETLEANKIIFITAAIVASVLLFIVIIVIIICIVRKKAAKAGDDKKKKKKGEPDDFYENLPFHGLQPPPNKPFKPVLPDLEYADVEFPPQSLNNNQTLSKAKIVERILDDVDDADAPSIHVPARPTRTKPSARD